MDCVPALLRALMLLILNVIKGAECGGLAAPRAAFVTRSRQNHRDRSYYAILVFEIDRQIISKSGLSIMQLTDANCSYGTISNTSAMKCGGQ